MISVNTPDELSLLPVEAQIISIVRDEIKLPFGSISATTKFWDQVGVNLLFIEENDDLESLACEYPVLSFTLQYPEWSLDLPQGYQLSLAIVNDEGGGCYLLCQSHLINKDNPS